MKNLLSFHGIVLFLAVFLTNAEAKTKTFKTLHVADLAALLEAKPSDLALYDVNVDSTRTHAGIIPGAKLLSSSNKYDIAKELPAVKSSKLVFYCANTRCTASHTAAKRAIEAGYSDVNVMVDGIYGWKSAGKAITPIQGEVRKTEARKMAPKEVWELLQKKEAVVVDVREAEERHEIVEKSLWIPMSRAEDAKAWAEFTSQLPKDKTVVVHCAAGFRSRKISQRLASKGIMTGFFDGPDQWKSAGLPLQPGPAH